MIEKHNRPYNSLYLSFIFFHLGPADALPLLAFLSALRPGWQRIWTALLWIRNCIRTSFFFFIENGVPFACLLKNDKKVLLLFLDILHLIRMNDEHVDVEKALERGMAGDEPTVLDYCTIRMY